MLNYRITPANCVSVSWPVQDLDDPLTGMYSFRTALDKRVAFLAHMLGCLERKPTGYVPNSVLKLQYLGLISSPGAKESPAMLQSPVRVV